ncbi:unnamed protein product [Meganyctiphanes norvegica]|uniref:Uncharacterized protein n=1 Tax=Meganyctiphanes norvegica TaxID=48144 RepID=A0AAV2RGJ8_MEGNR
MAHLKKNKKKDDSMLGVKDMEDLALEFRNLQKTNEEVQNKTDLKKAEVGLWMEILNAKTGIEIDEIAGNNPISSKLSPVTSEKQDLLTRYNELNGILYLYKLSGVLARLTPQGDIIVQFLPTRKQTFPDSLLLLLSQNKDDNTFSVVDHNLIDFVPVKKIAEDYLNGPNGNVKAFITQVAMHTSRMIKRHNMFQDVRERVLDKMYYNADRTKLNMVLPLQQDEVIK